MTHDAQAVAHLRRWRTDPAAFVREVFGAEPDAWQADALAAVERDKRVGMSACKGPGKSCLLAWVIWWFLATRVDAQIMALSITAQNLKDNLWKELAYWHGKSAFLQACFELSAERIASMERPRTWWVSARAFPQQADATQQANTLAGLHGAHPMIVLDEMGDYPIGVVAAAEAIFANEVDAHLVAAWNPTTTDGPAHRACTTDRARWTIIHITGDPEDPKRSPRISKQWAQDQIDAWGRDNPWVMVNVLGQFPHQASDKLIGVNAVITAMERDVPVLAYRAAARVWGLDPARFGDDEACLMRRQGVVSFRAHTWRSLDGVELATRVAELVLASERADEPPDMICVDVGGVGASAYDHLKLLGYAHLIHPVDFGGRAADGRFLNKRAEMWWEMAQWLKTQPACLPTDGVLQTELCAPRFFYRVVQRQTALALESKDEMKQRGVPSPNRADALALTFAVPVMPRSRKLEVELMGGGKIETSYDPLAPRDTGTRAPRVHDPLHPRVS